ncbi:ninjurin-1-like [Branchiostoma lanceolatum]|uniref:ninjurin-1-like n=1 Tax=Branchiostoma lanceolatum TaxID=7740 RepID=UPI0034522A67
MAEGAYPPSDEDIDQMKLGKIKRLLKVFGMTEDETIEMGKGQAREELKKRIRNMQPTTTTTTTTAAAVRSLSRTGHVQLSPEPEIPQQSSSQDKETFTQTKSMAQGFLDMALLVANAGQLKLVLSEGRHGRIFLVEFVLFLLVPSIVAQIAVAILLFLKSKYNMNNTEHHTKIDIVNNVATGLVMTITVLNVFISAFVMVDQQPYTAPAQAPATVAEQPALPTVGPVIDVPASSPAMTSARVPPTTCVCPACPNVTNL